jgi:cation transport regulator ChaC
MDSWYFAYGSNLWMNQMLARIGSVGEPAHPPRVGRLANHRLVFQTLERGGPAYANILSPGNGVRGVLYRLSAAALVTLDRYELGYARKSVQVTDELGEDLSAFVYVMRPGSGVKFGKPGKEYLERIIIGARQHAIPESYIVEVVGIAANGHRTKRSG